MTPTDLLGGFTPGAVPGDFFSRGQWNAYVIAGATREERKRRLAEVPDKWRAEVRRHAQTVFAIRKFHERKRREHAQPKRARTGRA